MNLLPDILHKHKLQVYCTVQTSLSDPLKGQTEVMQQSDFQDPFLPPFHFLNFKACSYSQYHFRVQKECSTEVTTSS